MTFVAGASITASSATISTAAASISTAAVLILSKRVDIDSTVGSVEVPWRRWSRWNEWLKSRSGWHGRRLLNVLRCHVLLLLLVRQLLRE